MAKRTHLHAVPSRSPKPAGGCEWIGARIPTTMEVDDGGKRHRPDAVIWAELPSGLVLGTLLFEPGENMTALRDVLALALAQPMGGVARAPDVVRVATEAEAALVASTLPPGTPVRVAPVPELHDLVRELEAAMRSEAHEASYLENGRVTHQSLARFFRATRELYRRKPWESALDSHLLRIDIPELGIDGACISILGALEETLGLAVFDSLDAYDAFEGAAVERDNSAIPILAVDDFGAAWTLLTFEPSAEIPKEMRREVRDHRWPLAGSQAYPLVLKHARDGTPDALDEHDLLFITVVADAVATFSRKFPTAFDDFADGRLDAEGIAVPHCGPDLPACTVTFPYGPEIWLRYDSADDFWDDDVDDEVESLDVPFESQESVATTWPFTEAPQTVKAGRNDPCPCGSGKKYKKCHQGRDAEQGREASATTWIHELDQRLLDEMRRFAEATFRHEWWQIQQEFPATGFMQMLRPQWACYHAPVRGRTVSEWFVEGIAKGQALGPAEREWIKAQQQAWLSLWEVRDIDAGRSLTLVDLLTGTERTVIEASASRNMRRRTVLLGRIVMHTGIAVISGLHPYPLSPLAAEQVVEAARHKLRLRGDVPVERMRDVAVGRVLLRSWEDALRTVREAASRPIDLRNTDGDALVQVADTYDVEPAETQMIAERISGLSGVHALPPDVDDGTMRFDLSAEGADGSGLDSVLIASVCLCGSELVVIANSVERADAVSARLESVCGALIRNPVRQHGDAAKALASRSFHRNTSREHGDGVAAEGEAVFEDAAAAVRAYKERHYRDWEERELPALAGRTPREVCGTKSGRHAVDLLLRDMECQEDAMPEAERYDFAQVRQRLGLHRS